MLPLEFKKKLIESARKLNKIIILPEGEDPRIIKAAVMCCRENVARCILLGNTKKILNIINEQGVKINNNLDIINPNKIRDKYVSYLIDLRKNKGMNESIASKYLKNNIVLSTLMLKKNEVDGLVSGIINTTADTIRPALQIIKTSPEYSIISSIFFMLFPKKVVIYGDCAINTNPNAEQLAEIAIQSAKSAVKFGIKPIIAMLSYATGNSSTGTEVEKVKTATKLVKFNYPNLIIDGPLQYDAAISPEVANIKAPNSKVAGKANIFIFPNLNSGNITYKAVQRALNLLAIGPILQGINKPVNDLSRGATIKDIFYTIVLTVIQSDKN